jgi:hypothetical protein
LAPRYDKEIEMQFMVSMITDGTYMQEAKPEQMQELVEEMGRFMSELQAAGALVHTGRLGPSAGARTLRYGERGRPVVTDGPFAESKEQFAGYMVIECEDIDEAVRWVERMPVRRASVEVREIAESG